MTENDKEEKRKFEQPRKILNKSFKEISVEEGDFDVKRGRGRPPKKNSSIQISCDFDCEESVLLNVTMQHSPSKMKPYHSNISETNVKSSNVVIENKDQNAQCNNETTPKRGRGRPPKAKPFGGHSVLFGLKRKKKRLLNDKKDKNLEQKQFQNETGISNQQNYCDRESVTSIKVSKIHSENSNFNENAEKSPQNLQKGLPNTTPEIAVEKVVELEDFQVKPNCSPEAQFDRLNDQEEFKDGQDDVILALNQSNVKRGRGRPTKRKPGSDQLPSAQFSQQKYIDFSKSEDITEDIESDFDEVPPKKQVLSLEQNPSGSERKSELRKKRGRPPKSRPDPPDEQISELEQNDLKNDESFPKVTKIKLLKTSVKSSYAVIENKDQNEAIPKRGRGRPPKAKPFGGHSGLFGLKKKKKIKITKLKKNRSPKLSLIKKMLKNRKLKKCAKEDSSVESSSKSNDDDVEESCDEIGNYMKTLGLVPADQMHQASTSSSIGGEKKKKKRGRPRKIILTKFEMNKNKNKLCDIEELQKRNEEMSREIWELSKINADLQNRLNYVPFLQEENHRLHLALHAEKQKLEKLSLQVMNLGW